MCTAIKLDRDFTAQKNTYVSALQELHACWKLGYWARFIFPQIDCLVQPKEHPCTQTALRHPDPLARLRGRKA